MDKYLRYGRSWIRLSSLLLSALITLGFILPVLRAEASADLRDDESFYMGHSKPSAVLLDELGAKIRYPKMSEYLSEFRLSYAISAKHDGSGRHINVCVDPDLAKNHITVHDGAPVLVLAKSGDSCCIVDMSQRRAGWISEKNLDDNYYGIQDPICTDIPVELSSWKDIISLCVSQGAVNGIRADGSIVSLRFSPEGENFSKWGKVKDMFSHGAFTYAVTKDNMLRLYADSADFYPVPVDELYDGSALSDCRYIKNVQKITGGSDGTMLCLSDGKLNYIFSSGMLAERPFGFDESFLYYDANRDRWCYRENIESSQKLYIQEDDGSFDWSKSKDVSKRGEYQFSSIAKNIVDIAGDSPYTHGFTALRKDGSLIFYGDDLTSLILGSDTYKDSDFSYLIKYLNVSALVSDQIYITEDAKLICLEGADGRSQGEPPIKSSAGLHPNIFGSWRNIVSAVYNDGALLAVDSKGRVLTDTADHHSLSQVLRRVGDWENIVSVALYPDSSQPMVFGLTRDGRVLSSLSQTSSAEDEPLVEATALIPLDGMYYLVINDFSTIDKLGLGSINAIVASNGSKAKVPFSKNGIKDCSFFSIPLVLLPNAGSGDIYSCDWQFMFHIKGDDPEAWVEGSLERDEGSSELVMICSGRSPHGDPITVDGFAVIPLNEPSSVLDYTIGICTPVVFVFDTEDAAAALLN